jgi:hydroxymethylpyrimidine pyrophosphatase-like HAD family hydrolase
VTSGGPAPRRPGPVRLIAVDLDGTLLDPSDEVTAPTVAAIAAARRRGVPVVPVTGRPDRLVWDVAAAAGLGPLGVAANGAVLLDLAAGAVLERAEFTAAAARALVDDLRLAIPGLALGADVGDVFVHEDALLAGLDLPARRGRRNVDDLRPHLDGGCLKLVARRGDLSSVELAAKVGLVVGDPSASGPTATGAAMDHLGASDRAEVTASDIAWVDIGPAGHTKATGLRSVCARLGVDLRHVAAVGDHFNDLPMLRAVGTSGAMGNAIPEVVRLADLVVASNAADGAAEFIGRVLELG